MADPWMLRCSATHMNVLEYIYGFACRYAYTHKHAHTHDIHIHRHTYIHIEQASEAELRRRLAELQLRHTTLQKENTALKVNEMHELLDAWEC
jgi:hypothetical protein